MIEFLKYFPLISVDEVAHPAYGLVTAECVDSDGGGCVYDDSLKSTNAKRASRDLRFGEIFERCRDPTPQKGNFLIAAEASERIEASGRLQSVEQQMFEEPCVAPLALSNSFFCRASATIKLYSDRLKWLNPSNPGM